MSPTQGWKEALQSGDAPQPENIPAHGLGMLGDQVEIKHASPRLFVHLFSKYLLGNITCWAWVQALGKYRWIKPHLCPPGFDTILEQHTSKNVISSLGDARQNRNATYSGWRAAKSEQRGPPFCLGDRSPGKDQRSGGDVKGRPYWGREGKCEGGGTDSRNVRAQWAWWGTVGLGGAQWGSVGTAGCLAWMGRQGPDHTGSQAVLVSLGFLWGRKRWGGGQFLLLGSCY